ncbi:nuclease-related domain-containing protein [Humibacter sp.]|uniref:nuclease-related domain-containing protein n=1 Tax=Humibacter sp. TaxID=1940291 RepID=UPI003F7FAF48
MPYLTVLWTVILVLALAVSTLFLILRRQRQRSRAQLEAQAKAHLEEVAAADSAHRYATETREAAHASRIRDLEMRIEAALEEAEQSRRMVATGLKWDEGSLNMILDACTDLKLDGCLVSNIVFVPTDAPRSRQFVAQVDHILITETGALVIENKGWRGVVFDGRHPSSVHAAFGSLFDESTLNAPFAIQMVRDAPGIITVRAHLEGESPCAQVRRQAQRVSDLVRLSTGASPWFETCVLYSHPDAVVYAKGKDSTVGGAATAVVAGAGPLRKALSEFSRRGTAALSRERNEEVIALFAGYGADVRRLGVYGN